MLYKKNNSPRLDMELFRSPSSEYRGTPFWAWNCKLEEKELCEQIEVLKKWALAAFICIPAWEWEAPILEKSS